MKKLKNFRTLEEGILLLQEEAKHIPISVREILHVLSGKGRALILVFLVLPFCQPIQIPGFSIPFGLVVAVIGLRMAFGKHVWLPKSMLSKTIKAETLKKVADKALLLIKKMKRWTHPRMNWMCHSQVMEIMNGLTVFMLGVFLALPLPIPLSNMIVAWSLFLIGLGILEDDGIFVVFGYLLSFMTLIFFVWMALSLKNNFWV